MHSFARARYHVGVTAAGHIPTVGGPVLRTWPGIGHFWAKVSTFPGVTRRPRMARMSGEPSAMAPGTGAHSAPWWSVLRALRDARSITREGWAARLGYGARTVQRWENGDSIPDERAETAILALCHELGLYRSYTAGPLAGHTLTPELVRDLLTGARLSGGTMQPLPTRSPHEQPAASPTAPSASAPEQPISNPPGNLPAPPSRLIGREQEQAALIRRLAATRLVTLTGPGGVGKTRLALQLAVALRDGAALDSGARWPDGIWLLELAALTEGALLPAAVQAAMTLPRTAEDPSAAGLAVHLAGKRLLLVLDNCEHLIDACAELAALLLTRCPGVSLLATSREPLNTPGEAVIAVPPLAQADAVDLFTQRAQAAHAGFAAEGPTLTTVSAICARLDGIPLAIELAAARVRHLSLDEMLARMDQMLGLLTGGARTALPRQQTLRAAITWSYELLSADERRWFTGLAAFTGSFPLAAALAACGNSDTSEGEAMDTLGSLVDKSLVLRDEAAGESRYQLLEPLRQYAVERLNEAVDAEAIRKRHGYWYLALAQQARPKLTGTSQSEWLTRLDRDLPNLRLALDWAGREDQEVGLRIAAALGPYWLVRGHLREGHARLVELLARDTTAPSDPAVRAAALQEAAVLARRLGDMAAAETMGEAGLALWRELEDRRGVAAATGQLAILARYRGDYQRARELHEEGLVARRALGDRQGIAAALTNLGVVAHAAGEYEEACHSFSEGLALFRELDDARGIAVSLNNLGEALLHRGVLQEAERLGREALQRGQTLGDRTVIAAALHVLAETAGEQGRMEEARGLAEQGLREARELSFALGITEALVLLGRLARDLDDQPQAWTAYTEALRFGRDGDDKAGIARCLDGIAALLADAGRHTEAVRLWAAAVTLRTTAHIPRTPPETRHYQPCETAARATLGETAFTRAWEAGATLSAATAVQQALAAAATQDSRHDQDTQN